MCVSSGQTAGSLKFAYIIYPVSQQSSCKCESHSPNSAASSLRSFNALALPIVGCPRMPRSARMLCSRLICLEACDQTYTGEIALQRHTVGQSANSFVLLFSGTVPNPGCFYSPLLPDTASRDNLLESNDPRYVPAELSRQPVLQPVWSV